MRISEVRDISQIDLYFQTIKYIMEFVVYSINRLFETLMRNIHQNYIEYCEYFLSPSKNNFGYMEI